MAHVRQQIREAAAAALTGLTTSGSRVYQSRVHPLDSANLPCLLVSTDEETSQRLTFSSPAFLDRRLVLSVRAVAKAAANLDDTLDTMIAEVETAIGESTLSGNVKLLILDGISIDIEQGDKPVGIATMKFSVTYMTAANAPETSI